MTENKAKNKTEKNAIRFTIVAIVLIAVFCISITPITLQNDTYYTIKIGEHITKYGIDMQDPFSWHENLNYTYPHWLYDLITYYLYSGFGFAGIYVVTSLLSAILGITIFIVNKKLAKNDIISFLVTIGAMYLLKPYIAARAQLVTFILFILTILFIEKFLEKKKIGYAISLIVIPIIIANVHTAVFPFYFILYLPYIGEYIISCIAESIAYRKATIKGLKTKIKILEKQGNPENEEKLLQLKEKLKIIEQQVERVKIKRSKELDNPYKIKLQKNDNVKWLIIIMIICILTGLLTPLGTTPYTYLLKTMQGNTTQNINEHLPITLAGETHILIALVLFLAILIFTKTKIRLCDLFMLGGLVYLMISSRRQVSMFAIICSIILNRLIISTIFKYIKEEEIAKAKRRITSIIGILIITVLTLILSFNMAYNKRYDKFVNTAAYPVEACDFILQNIDLGTAKFYNEYNYGSYMLYRGIPVFIDSRADLYAPEFSGKQDDIFMDFMETSGINKWYEDIFEKYGITHVITYKNSKMNMIISKTQTNIYKELYQDDHFVIYEIE